MTNQELHEFYENYHTNHLKHALVEMPFRFAYWRNRLQHFIPSNKKAAVLDLGCGTGDFLLFLKNQGFTNLTGIEYSEEMKAMSEQTTAGIRIIYNDATAYLAETKSQYDFIICAHLLEHFEKSKVLETLKLAKDRLNPGGRLVIFTPNFASPFGLMIAFGDFTHITHFSGIAMAQLANMSGFEIDHIGGNGPVPFGISGTVKSWLWRFILKPIGKAIFSNGHREYGNVVDPELIAVFRKA